MKCGKWRATKRHPKFAAQRGQLLLRIARVTVMYRLRMKSNDYAMMASHRAIADLGGPVWGTRIYSDDSSACVAARHHTGQNGGIFLVRAGSGRSALVATRANGVLRKMGAIMAGLYRGN